MSVVDLTPVLQPLLDVAGLVITGLLTIYVPKAISIFEAKTHVEVSEQQRQVIIGAVQTAAGVVETKLDQGVMSVAQVHIADPTVLAVANGLIAQVPDAAKAMGMSSASVANMIVGAVDTASRTVPPIVSIPSAVKG